MQELKYFGLFLGIVLIPLAAYYLQRWLLSRRGNVPARGDTIWVPPVYIKVEFICIETAGGKATVAQVRRTKDDGVSDYLLSVREIPCRWIAFSWKNIIDQQEQLRQQFGEQPAHQLPSPEFIHVEMAK